MADPTPSPNAAEPNTSPNAVPTQAGQAYEATIAGSASVPQPAASSSTATLAVGTRLDTYELLEKLGEGGMGTVWKARHLKLDKLVALKVLPEHLTNDPETVRRFEREMRAVAMVEHPHVVRAMDARELGRLHFLVMEYVEGVDLSKYVKTRGPRSVPDACVMLRHAALGLAAAHAQGLIHRDIKPSNLLLSKQGQVKVLDLGLARLMAEGHEPRQLTHSGQVLGTPDFMAPEQWDDTHAVDHLADLYALGCTLCFLLTGRAPFGDERHSTMGQKMKGHLLEAPPHLRDLRSDVPQELEDLYSRLMMKEPAQRLASAAEVAIRLKEIAQGLSTKTVPVGEASKVMDSGTAVQDATAQPAAASPTMTFAPEKSTHDSLESTAKRTELARPLPLRSSTPPLPPRNRWTLAAAGGAALLLLGVIVITITNKDGTKSTIRVSEGTDADVVAAPGSKVTIRQENDHTASSPTSSIGNSGWHGWPADAPKPAIAPFDTDQAKKHQEEWAAYLKVPVEYTNSIGMKFRLIPPGEFMMGSTPAEIEAAMKFVIDNKYWEQSIKSESPKHKVILTQPIFLGVHEVTQQNYQAVMKQNPSHFSSMGQGKDAVVGMDTANYPVDMVSWNDAAEFCATLSENVKLKPFYSRTGESVTELKGTGYRLPTEAEWEFACRAGTTTKYWVGDADDDLLQAAWFVVNSNDRTHEVGQLKRNPFGLYDISGNVWEWVQDRWEPTYYGQFQDQPARDPMGPITEGFWRVIRAGGWEGHPSHLQPARRIKGGPHVRNNYQGFRVALLVDAVRAAMAEQATQPTVANTSWHGWPADAPKPAIAPFDADQAKKHQEEWAAYLKVPVEYTNSIGMKFRLIPPGEFMMGSNADEIETALKAAGQDTHWQECIKSEAPRHKVILAQPVYIGIHEVTQEQYVKVMGQNPSHFAPMGTGKDAVVGMDTANHPVETVIWNDAVAFGAKLSRQDNLERPISHSGPSITPVDGAAYRLLSEAEWEFACRAGTTTKYWLGDKNEDLFRAFWFAGNSGARTHAVGELQANPFGLFDVHGNVWEWVQDIWEPRAYETVLVKPSSGQNGTSSPDALRVLRGGDLLLSASHCRSARRDFNEPSFRDGRLGFRMALAVDAVNAAIMKGKLKASTESVGWHGWPADAPKPAIAPFDADQAKKHQEVWAAYLKVPVEYTNSTGMKFRLIPPGEFTMGIANLAVAEAGTLSSEQWSQKLRRSQPEHRVVISQPFYFSIHETTQSQFTNVVGRNLFHFCKSGKGKELIKELDTDQYPAEMISFQDAVEFANLLSTTEALPKTYTVEGTSITRTNEKGYRLPTEAEWEYAVRAGNTMHWYFGNDKSRLRDVAWIAEYSAGTTHPVGRLAANPFGLHDVCGNVCEWCEDWFDANGYRAPTESLDVDPRGPASGETRVIRGSGWFGDPIWSFSGWRDGIRPDYRYNDNGVRLVLSVDDVRQLIK